MKHLLFLLIALFIFVGCDSVNEPELTPEDVVLTINQPYIELSEHNYITGILPVWQGREITIKAKSDLTFKDVMQGTNINYWVALRYDLATDRKLTIKKEQIIYLKYQDYYWVMGQRPQ